MPVSYVLDANLLVLLVVGRADRNLIRRHRRLRRFSAEDYDILCEMLDRVDEIVVTPNTLTETSNLLGYAEGDRRSSLFGTLRSLIEDSIEVVVPSIAASSRTEFSRLGLTDTVLLEAISRDSPLLTVDLELVRAAWTAKPESAINFTLEQSVQ